MSGLWARVSAEQRPTHHCHGPNADPSCFLIPPMAQMGKLRLEAETRKVSKKEKHGWSHLPQNLTSSTQTLLQLVIIPVILVPGGQ